jgi:phospholipid/cholesterol/gamma-HCH transport system substrate-binding protein
MATPRPEVQNDPPNPAADQQPEEKRSPLRFIGLSNDGVIKRSVRIRLMLFVLITLVGVSYVGAKYVGLTKGILGSSGCTVYADFPDSGGIFGNAEVTYRGVTVGRVGNLTLIHGGVRVGLNLSNCTNPKVPASAMAVVADRSVVGEQYVNLVPPNGSGPYLTGGQIIPMSRNKIPVSTQALLINLDNLVTSVHTDKLATMVAELGKAFNGRGAALGDGLDATQAFITAAQQNLPVTLQLLESQSTVLQTQLDEAPALASFTHSLNLLSQQLKASNGDVNALLDGGPGQLSTLSEFIQNNRTDFGVTLANVATANDLVVRHLAGVRQILEIYPLLLAPAMTIVHTSGISYLGMVLNNGSPQDCGDPANGGEGYGGTTKRSPDDVRPVAPNTAAHCNLSPSTGRAVRGAQNVPGGDPMSTSGGQVAYPRVVTGDSVRIASTGSLSAVPWMSLMSADIQ